MKEEYNIKDILRQLVDLRQERIDKQEAIKRLEAHLERMEADGYTEVDSVTGGNGGQQHFKIEGFPYPEYSRARTRLQQRILNLREIEEKIEQQIATAENFINCIDDSQLRRMITYRFVDDLTWFKVAQKMEGNYTADGCRMAIERYLKKFDTCSLCSVRPVVNFKLEQIEDI